MVLYFSPLLPVVIPKLRSWLTARPELEGAVVKVSDRVISGATRLVRVMDGAGSGQENTIDTPSLRVSVRVSDGLENASDALDELVALVRAFFDGPAADGEPVTWSRVSLSPVSVDAPTGSIEKYLVVDLRRHGAEL